MSIISQNKDNESEVSDFATKFIREFHIGKLLFRCNAGKEKGIPVMNIFSYLLCLLFAGRSDYMQRKTGTFEGGFSKNTMYRFLNSIKTNWQRFIVLLSSKIITGFMEPLTSEDRKNVFIIDDSLFDRSRSKKTELLANAFDHCSMKFKKGYRMLTLVWLLLIQRPTKPYKFSIVLCIVLFHLQRTFQAIYVKTLKIYILHSVVNAFV